MPWLGLPTRVAVSVVPGSRSVSLPSTPAGWLAVDWKATWPIKAAVSLPLYWTKLAANEVRLPDPS